METLVQVIMLAVLFVLLLGLPFWLWTEAGWFGLLGGFATWALFAYSVAREHGGVRS